MNKEEEIQKDRIQDDVVADPSTRAFWEMRWQNNNTGWDIGFASPAICAFADSLTDKQAAILIPGCGNAYEARYLADHGFTNITLLDIAPAVVERLQESFEKIPAVKVICDDFFEHEGIYDLMLEQTFFCAIPPASRMLYAGKSAALLSDRGMLAGLLFDRGFENPGPPFGGTAAEYANLFEPYFDIHKMERCYNSIEQRRDTELFIKLNKKQV